MKLGDYISQLMTVFGNMVYTDDNKISPRMLEAEFPKWKQQALLIIYNGSGGIKGVIPPTKSNKFINAKNYVQTKLEFNLNIQEDGAEYVLFDIEPAVQMTSGMNGLSFVGDKLTGKPFSQLTSPNSYGINKDAGLIGVNDVAVYVSGSLLKAYGNTQIKEIYLDYIPLDVTNVKVYNSVTKTYSLFNPETDEYPISEDVWDIMKALAIAEFTPANYRPADYTNDATSTIEKQSNA